MADIDERSDVLENVVITAVDIIPNGKAGCAYYDMAQEVLFYMQDMQHDQADFIETLKLEIGATTVLVSMRTEGVVESKSVLNDTENHRVPWDVVIRPTSDFKFESALSKIADLTQKIDHVSIRFLVPGERKDLDSAQGIDELGLVEQQGRLRVNGVLDLENTSSIGCIGCVLNHINKRRASEYLHHDQDADLAYAISRIEIFTLDDTMLLDADALRSLQIIGTEVHPSVGHQGPGSSGSKESLSLYGLFHHLARTPQGKSELKRLFLRPSLDMKKIMGRHDFITAFNRTDGGTVTAALCKSLSRVKNMRMIIVSLRKGIERGNQSTGTIRSGVWASLLEFCYHAIDIGDTLAGCVATQDLDFFTEVDEILDRSQLQQLGKIVHHTVDLDESLEQNRTVIKRGINEDLDQIKSAYDAMEEVLARLATEITDTMPMSFRAKLNVVFLPQLGFHVAVPLSDLIKPQDWDIFEHWDCRFNTETEQYFKNDRMRQMDEEWGDLHAVICDTEIEISHNLAQHVLQHQEWLIEASDWCGKLDSLLALAQGAVQYKLVKPQMVNDNVIDIAGGRHVLQEMVVPTYVANDILIVGNSSEAHIGPSMILMTGPNCSGKSVLQKSVALIVYLAQVGSFVPADSARLGLTDRIFTQINVTETVSKAQSAFMTDLQQISRALRFSTDRSLLITDEFGKGTDNCDGAALAFGVFKYLLDIRAKVLASTHFHEILIHRELLERPNLKIGHMRIYVSDGDGENVTYLYQLDTGHCPMSLGTHCALTSGVPPTIVKRAATFAKHIANGEDLVSVCAKLPLADTEELQNAESCCRRFMNRNLNSQSLDVKAVLEEIQGFGSR